MKSSKQQQKHPLKELTFPHTGTSANDRMTGNLRNQLITGYWIPQGRRIGLSLVWCRIVDSWRNEWISSGSSAADQSISIQYR
jgi:hypothetical protein